MTDIPASTLAHLLNSYAIQRWDILLIGDGSGSAHTLPCGWAVVIIDRMTGLRTLLVGGQNMGSITLAELLPYLVAMQYYDRHLRTPTHEVDTLRKLDVHIFTDSQHTAMAGQGEHSRSKYGALWAGMDHFGKIGYQLHWHWFEGGRENPFLLHKLTDEIASEGRSLMKSFDQTSELYELLPPGEGA